MIKWSATQCRVEITFTLILLGQCSSRKFSKVIIEGWNWVTGLGSVILRFLLKDLLRTCPLIGELQIRNYIKKLLQRLKNDKYTISVKTRDILENCY